MHKFTHVVDDAQGQPPKVFCIELTIGTARRIKRELDIDLVDLNVTETMTKLIESPYTRMDVLYAMLVRVSPAIDDSGPPGINQNDFYDCLNAETTVEADLAFWGEIDVFFRAFQPATAEAIKQMVAKAKMMADRYTKQVTKWMESPEVAKKLDELDDMLQSEMQKQTGNISTNLQERLESRT